ncbi:MAG: hypothetical protein KDC34_10855 [Saprospiraceae bacterium]|nr:hypothetical protein [Saprospiraceae bacterium]
MDQKRYKLKQVIDVEDMYLVERRKKLSERFGEEEELLEESRFGIALSGGGIRSATINLGFLKTLNHFGILRKADYLSTVSGGGYTGAYIQATMRNQADFDQLFHKDHIEHLRSYGAYLIPGQTTFEKLWNTILLIVGYLFSWVMSLLSMVLVFGLVAIILFVLNQLHVIDLVNRLVESIMGSLTLVKGILLVTAVVGGIHLFANLVAKFGVGISRVFNKGEAVLLLLVVLFVVPTGIDYVMHVNIGLFDFLKSDNLPVQFLVIFGMLLLGVILDPNAVSFHRFYRSQLTSAFLAFAGNRRNVRLRELVSEEVVSAPYPLINTCLNLQNPAGDEKFKGAKASDYFLLSPLFSGAKLTGYVSTKEFPGYRDMTLPAATTISAAAVNPGMGIYSNKLLSILMTIFNARLGFWVNNPLKESKNYLVWWPLYFFYELLSKIGTNNRKLNISDGGHIENLAVYELLRRRCRLIVAVDAGADPFFNFSDLENLAIRARNELGVEIRFRIGEDPDQVIRPKSSNGYSGKRYAIADLYRMWDEYDLLDSNGNPIMDDCEKPVPIEVLVNYMPDGKWDPDISLKGQINSELRRAELMARAKFILDKRLADKKDLTGREKVKFGTLVYVKSSVTAPTIKPNIPIVNNHSEPAGGILSRLFSSLATIFRGDGLARGNYKYDTYKYKIYHPAFPHEPTSDQFFDPVQWESYFQLGQFIAADVLKLDSREFNLVSEGKAKAEPLAICDLLKLFDGDTMYQVPVPGRVQVPTPAKDIQPVIIREKAAPDSDEPDGTEYRM